MAMGLVELQGIAVPGSRILRTPISNKECVLYTTFGYIDDYTKEQIKDFVENGKDDIDFVTNNPFYLDDGTGRVLIDPRNVELRLIHSNKTPLETEWIIEPG